MTRPSEGWVEVGPAADLPVDELSAMTLTTATGERAEVIVVNVGQRLSAYRNECAHEALPLDNAVLDLANDTLTCPWHGFCYDATLGGVPERSRRAAGATAAAGRRRRRLGPRRAR